VGKRRVIGKSYIDDHLCILIYDDICICIHIDRYTLDFVSMYTVQAGRMAPRRFFNDSLQDRRDHSIVPGVDCLRIDRILRFFKTETLASEGFQVLEDSLFP
jgi:hypothetical protein